METEEMADKPITDFCLEQLRHPICMHVVSLKKIHVKILIQAFKEFQTFCKKQTKVHINPVH